ncbi:unnamed protein product [Paramecium primaurelia]|uniref:Uncharacterized protein n=1 Tax=Paramecium primaurelia TaxID=5886 RepID=A0A8S1LHA3_PARPR|nr:unnamed protein product [Paramecium primaurelia]
MLNLQNTKINPYQQFSKFKLHSKKNLINQSNQPYFRFLT